MRNKVIDIYQSGKGYKAISKVLRLQRNYSEKWRTFGTVVNLPKSGRANQNSSKSASTTHPGGHKRAQTNI